MWRFPRRIPKSGRVADSEDLNEGFFPLVAASGHLGEGNWQDDMSGQLNSVTEVAAGIAYDASFVGNAHYAGGPVDTAIAGGLYGGLVQIGSGWTQVASATRTIDVEVGPVIVMASFQHGRRRPNNGSNEPDRHAYVHVQYGIRLDGSTLPISVVGDQDSGSEGQAMERGLWNYRQGVDIFQIVDVAPGRHTFELVCHAEGELGDLEGDEDDPDQDDFVVIYSYELLAVEVK